MSIPVKKFIINGESYELKIHEDIPLLWLLRDNLGLTGTKYGCGIGVCGACNVLINNKSVPSCQVMAASVTDVPITTIEGLSTKEGKIVQNAWIEEQVPQCGYCQPGQIIAATALLLEQKEPTEVQINNAMSAVLCRCGTYQRVKRAIAKAIDANLKQ